MVSAMYGFQDEQLGVLPELPCSRCPDDVVLGALIPVVFRPFRRVRRRSCVHLASCLMLLALARFVMLDASFDENCRFFTMFLVLTACRVVLIKRSPLQEVNEASRVLFTYHYLRSTISVVILIMRSPRAPFAGLELGAYDWWEVDTTLLCR